MLIRILTRCTRPENLLLVKKSIEDSYKKNFLSESFTIKYTWHIIVDTSVVKHIDVNTLKKLEYNYLEHSLERRPLIDYEESEPGDMGHTNLNKFIKSFIKSSSLDMKSFSLNMEYVYILDDDNEMHIDFFDSLSIAYMLNEEQSYYPSVYVFSQNVNGKDFTGLNIREAKPENMKVQKVDMAQFLIEKSMFKEFEFAPNTYTADGILIESIFNKYPEKFCFLNSILCNYNSLQNVSKPASLPRILQLGEKFDMRSFKHFDFESDDLNVVHADNKSAISIISSFNPDCIFTSGDSYTEFPSLGSLSYDFRQRWRHTTNDVRSGESAYTCAMNYILNADIKDLVSIVTPVHKNSVRINRTYESLTRQTHKNWEWVIVVDSDDYATADAVSKIASNDPRVKIYDFAKKTKGIIGEAKYRGFSLSRGSYMIELDHDDYLLPHAIENTLKAFNKYPDAGFVYSDCAEIDENYRSLTYGESFAFGYGSYKEETHIGIKFQVANTPNINPLTIRHIVGVPNHLRAWKRSDYFSIGGHNRRLSIADDYELLVRTFLKTKMVRIPTCCYLQFQYGGNSQNSTRSDIQRRVRTISLFYSKKIKARFEELGKFDWAYIENGLSWNITPLINEEENYVNYIL